jgi:chlorite dismutase
MCEKMTFGIQKVQRGQVWYIEEAEEVTKVLREHGSKALNGTRPYFVVKVTGNMAAVIPMTTNTLGSNRPEDIVFENPINGTESRLVISQITTKGINEFGDYFYTFDEKSIDIIMNRIKTAIFGEMMEKKEPAVVSITESKPTDIKEEVKETPKAEIPFLPDEVSQFEMRLRKYFSMPPMKRKKESMFRTQREGLIFMEKYCDRPVEELTKTFGVDKPTVYRMRSKAKEAAYKKGGKVNEQDGKQCKPSESL